MTLRVLHNVSQPDDQDFSVALANHLRAENEEGAIDAVDSLLKKATLAGASDVHIEPWESATVIRFRVDGVMTDVAQISSVHHRRLVARIKVLARMATYHKDAPQDGRIDATASPCAKTVRVSAMPTVGGEKIVLRIMDASAGLQRLDALGFPEAIVQSLRDFARRPQGTLLLTGPSSSGKTTTIYALVRELLAIRSTTPHVVTVEDPVEYRLDRVDQTEVNAAAGLTFEAALRALLRQDPEVIVVGEIRDTETARMAVQAGLTGHLVISTIHSGSAAGVFTRLLDMGVEPYLVSSSITGALSQRLVRRVCSACKRPVAPPDHLRTRFGLPDHIATVEEGEGCAACLNTGYSGRIAIGEWLPLSEATAESVINRSRTTDIERQAVAAGMRTLQQAGLDRVIAGETTLQELDRVILPATERA